jgi:hypothetical protein
MPAAALWVEKGPKVSSKPIHFGLITMVPPFKRTSTKNFSVMIYFSRKETKKAYQFLVP